MDPTLPHNTLEYAQKKVTRLVEQAARPVLAVRVRISLHHDPAVSRPVIAQANLDIQGRPVCARVTAATAREAIDLLDARLHHRLERIAKHWQARRAGRPSNDPGDWRRGQQPTPRPDWYPRPVEERQIIRHRSVPLAGNTCDDAALDMDAMGYEFRLFTETGSGQHSVLYRAEDGFRLAQVNPQPGDVIQGYLPVTISPMPAPLLSLDEAIQRLELTGSPFVFFLDGEHLCGSVLHRRYDGHYGLITPTD
jgi:hypothetical protein